MELDTIACGHILDVTPQIPNGRFHCSCTSPPYYGLRKYAGDQKCDWPEVEYAPMPGLPPIRVEAWRGALGHEPTIEMYVGDLVAVYREVWRIGRADSVHWIVMGDSYAGGGGGNYSTSRKQTKHGQHITNIRNRDSWLGSNNVKPGDLMLVPHRLALALQADGWTVRNDNPWAKKAPMPESVAGWRWQRHRIKIRGTKCLRGHPQEDTNYAPHGSAITDRPMAQWTDCPGCPKCEATGGYVLRRGSWRHTRAHEVVFMLTKKMQYWSDQEAVREPNEMKPQRRLTQRNSERDQAMRDDKKYLYELRDKLGVEGNKSGRNPRSVLNPSPEPFPGPHFAVYPTGLIEPLIKATCPARCCPECGQGWAAVVNKEVVHHPSRPISGPVDNLAATRAGQGTHGLGGTTLGMATQNNILGYRPTCGCGRGDWVPGVVFDPFIGSGTTAVIAVRLGLRFYGCDVSQRYIDMAMDRIAAERDKVEEERLKAAQMEMFE